jgi:hypothetical protein
MAQSVVFFVANLDLSSREGPRLGGEILGCVLASAMPPKTPIVDVVLKRGEDLR